VFVDGVDVNRELVAQGLAWHYVKYSDDEGLAEAEAAAREAGVGLWADEGAVAPWEWRRGRRQ
jgi:endonuclease YncB( thermonuclease family)